jgi:hypothetical protein
MSGRTTPTIQQRQSHFERLPRRPALSACSGLAIRAGAAIMIACRRSARKVSGGGRIFYIIDEGSRITILTPAKWTLVARDAFNGTVLWKSRSRSGARTSGR